MIQGYCSHCESIVPLLVVKTVPDEPVKKYSDVGWEPPHPNYYPTEFAFCQECGAWNSWL